MGGSVPTVGQTYVAPVPVGMEPGTPFGASIEGLATYLRYTHAISDERLSALFAQVYGVPISEGALANLFQRVNTRLDDRVAEILTRLRSSRLICSDETGARVNGRTPWAWVFQNTEVCVHVIRPSRGHGRHPRNPGRASPDHLGLRSLQCPKEPPGRGLAGLFGPSTAGLPICPRGRGYGVVPRA